MAPPGPADAGPTEIDALKRPFAACGKLRPEVYGANVIAVPVFEVTIEGRGFRIPMGDKVAGMFFRLVRIVALDERDAEVKALALAQTEWDASPNARLNQGSDLRLRVEAIATLPWWHRFRRPRRGYIFAPEDDETGAV
jgi:hypothetical protein